MSSERRIQGGVKKLIKTAGGFEPGFPRRTIRRLPHTHCVPPCDFSCDVQQSALKITYKHDSQIIMKKVLNKLLPILSPGEHQITEIAISGTDIFYICQDEDCMEYRSQKLLLM